MRDWLARRSYGPGGLPGLTDLLAARGDETVCLVIPTLQEAATISGVVSAVLADPACAALLSEVAVIDGGSTDGTPELAAAAGARVLRATDIAHDLPVGGKGGAVWRALQQTTADLLVLVDADLDPFEPSWVVSLVAPLLMDSDLHLVKAATERPLQIGEVLHPRSGGRVTELVAKPVLAALRPELSGFAQPLSGELAARRSLLERLPFATGYGLEIGMLLDAHRLVGLDGLAQVRLGERRHRHHGDLELGRMASAVLRTALSRAGLPDLPDTLLQTTQGGLVETTVPLLDLPPLVTA